MANSNLNNSQKKLLKWLVNEVDIGNLDENEIWFSWSSDGTQIIGYDLTVPDVKSITLEALEKEGFLICQKNKNDYKCSLTAKAYGAVHNNFESKDTPHKNSILIENSSKQIWIKISNHFGINKQTFGKRINFITDKFKREIIFRDVEQAYVLAFNGYYKPSVIMSGSVIEELLRLYLEHKNIISSNNTLKSYIKTCENNKVLKESIRQLSDSYRYFRNIVHLENEKTRQDSISQTIAVGAMSTIFALIDDF